VLGEGPPIVLLHGFASSRKRNWDETRWFATLTGAGRRVVALDCRGHGASDKPRDPASYAADLVGGDVLRLMDHLRVARADLMGYSMGAHIATGLLLRHPQRFGAAILAGVGAAMLGHRAYTEAVAQALEAPDAASVRDANALAFRTFAEQGRNDLQALAACMRGLQHGVEAVDLARIAHPVLVVAGERDTLIGDPRRLVQLIPAARLLLIPGRDHINAVGDRRYKEAVLAFLGEHGLRA
jgi:pimeloyl-ACP methyl ester carboxylesterase